MFSLLPGPLTQYENQFIKLLSEVDNSKYIFYADVSHVYEVSSYDDLDKEKLQIALNKDLEEWGDPIVVDHVISVNAPEHGGWPFIRVKNSRPMTLKEFLDTINDIYMDEPFDYVIHDCLDMFGVIEEV